MKTLEERLKHYEIEIEMFNVNIIEDEIDIFYIQREILEDNKNKLNNNQKNILYVLDKKAVDLYNKTKIDKTIAVKYLEKIVKEFALSNISEYEKLHKKIA